ncbi:MAG: CDP-glycerol glycerophosphotransferase family protein [Desulfovibrio sp.]|nr:CDP-glycerol glycerophosphotransferase family protein [Desulfovibrio sp.]
MNLRKIRIAIKNLTRNLYYRFFCILKKQNSIILYSSSNNDQYGNITALAEEFKKRKIPTVSITAEWFFANLYAGLRLLASAKVIAIDASSPATVVPLIKKTILINCWHALGAYKKIGFDAKRKGVDARREEKRIRRIHRSLSYFITSSPYTSRIYAKAFHLEDCQMKAYGSPRMDAVLSSPRKAPELTSILYAPTFRTKHSTRFMPQLPDAKKIKDALAKNGISARLCFRSHPTVPGPFASDGWEDWSQLPQLEALEQASLLITDYSSIFFDFLPFCRPILFYVPDYQLYIDHERELYFSPYELFPETTSSNEADLVIKIVENIGCPKNYDSLIERYLSSCDGTSTKRICDFILSLAKEHQ